MADTLLDFFSSISEFYHDPLTGQNYNGTCTQTAFECCICTLDKRWADQGHMAVWARDMIAHGLSQSNGASTVAAIAKYGRSIVYKTPVEWDFGTVWAENVWHDFIVNTAGIHPILLQVANGQALVDAETGSRDEAGLHYHAIAIGGKQSTGYICADGDNPEAGKRKQIYTWTTLVAAQPCGLVEYSW